MEKFYRSALCWGRSLLQYGIFLLLSLICNYTTVANSEFYQNREQDDSQFVYAFLLLLAFFMLNSLARLFSYYDGEARDAYLARAEDGQDDTGELVAYLESRGFLIGAATMALLFAALPQFVYFPLSFLLYGRGVAPGFGHKMAISAIYFAVYLLLAVVWHLRSRERWAAELEAPPLRVDSNARRVGSFLLLFAIYPGAVLLMPRVNPVIYTAIRILAVLPVIPALLIALTVALVAFWCIFVRAMRRRRRFLRRLRKFCADRHYTLRLPDKPLRALILWRQEVTFSIDTPRASYRCRLLGSVLPRRPMTFLPDGQYFSSRHFVGEYTLADTSAHRLILLSPAPRVMQLRGEGQTKRIYSGDRIGVYTVYADEDFLQMAERRALPGDGAPRKALAID